MSVRNRWLLFISLIISIILTSCSTRPADHVIRTRIPQVHKDIYPDPQVLMTANFSAPVFMYHRIDFTSGTDSAVTKDLTVSPSNFNMQMKYLEDNGYTFISASDIVDAIAAHKPLPVKAVSITIDDGYSDNFTNAFPILKKYSIPATIFLVTGDMGAKGHLTWQEVMKMHDAGIDFEPHTVTHPDLRALSDDKLMKELNVSMKSFKYRSLPVTTMAYPSGDYDDRVVEAVKNAGYIGAWAKSGSFVRPSDDLYRLPRIRVRGSTSLAQFKMLLGRTSRTMHHKR